MRAARTADDLDAINICQQIILHVPKYSGEQRRVDCAPILEDQELVSQGGVKSARADGPIMGILLRDFQIISQSQGLGNAGSARALDVLPRDDLDRRRRFPIRLGSLATDVTSRFISSVRLNFL